MKVVGIIPARAGSKGVPHKNKKIICGKPLITYTIEAALSSKHLTSIIVSSDDNDILDIARQYSAIKIHERSSDMASDTSPISETVDSILDTEDVDAVMLLQPTSPIRRSTNIDDSISILRANPEINSVISVVEMTDIHPARMYWNENGKLISTMPEFETVRRQDIPPAYYRNGSIYLTRKSAFKRSQSFVAQPILPYVMPLEWLLNIDEPRDLLIAEVLLSAFIKQHC